MNYIVKEVFIMAEENKAVQENEAPKTGSVNISNDVVSIVASLAASSVKGVSGMVSSMSGGIAELLGKKNMSKGVKVSVSDKDVTLNLSIIVEYGAKIPDVAWEIQEKVKSEVEAMTGLNVIAVNVSVEGVNVPKSDAGKIAAQPVKSVDAAETVKDAAEELVDKAADKAAELAEKAESKIDELIDKAKEVVDETRESSDEAEDEAEDSIEITAEPDEVADEPEA